MIEFKVLILITFLSTSNITGEPWDDPDIIPNASEETFVTYDECEQYTNSIKQRNREILDMWQERISSRDIRSTITSETFCKPADEVDAVLKEYEASFDIGGEKWTPPEHLRNHPAGNGPSSYLP